VIWEVLRREVDRARRSRPHLTVPDVGGGTGGFAVPLAQGGHNVTVVDASPDALASFEYAAAARSPFRDIASHLHLLARTP
jgi:S-adenosylmethionine-dependent methyltransferase